MHVARAGREVVGPRFRHCRADVSGNRLTGEAHLSVSLPAGLTVWKGFGGPAGEKPPRHGFLFIFFYLSYFLLFLFFYNFCFVFYFLMFEFKFQLVLISRLPIKCVA